MELSNTAFQYMILAIVVLVVLNVATLLVVFATGIGKRVLQRMKQRWMYKWGKHVNIIFIGNNHVSHELFLKKEEDGSVHINNHKYCVNPKATFIHDGIPTQINHEGVAEPYNIFDDKDADKMSTAELENIIMNNEIDGVAELLKKLFFWFLIISAICAIAAGVAAYYGYALHDYIIKKHLIEQGVFAAQQAAQNATNVMPR